MSDHIKLEVDNSVTHVRFRARREGMGPPGDDDMDRRVTELERNFLQISIDLATIKGKIEDMPTKDWVTTRLFWAVGAFSGVVALITAVQTLILQ